MASRKKPPALGRPPKRSAPKDIDENAFAALMAKPPLGEEPPQESGEKKPRAGRGPQTKGTARRRADGTGDTTTRVVGLVPDDLARQFRLLCVSEGWSQSHGLEQALRAIIGQRDN